jgi:hypothetical protein
MNDGGFQAILVVIQTHGAAHVNSFVQSMT